MKSYIINRLKEPSTWTALGAIGFVFGLPPGTLDAVYIIFGGVASLCGIFLPETETA